MTQDNVIKLSQPGTFSDLLTEILRNGARALLTHAVLMVASAWCATGICPSARS